MKIHLTALDHGIIWWSALNYKQEEVHKVAYGLQVKEFATKKEAAAEVVACINHAEACMS